MVTAAEKEYLISFENVSFAYSIEANVFTNISFQIPQNSISGICGLNGVGKSTIFKLLLGIFDDYKGRIMILGQDLKKLSPKVRALLFAYIGIVEESYLQLSVLDLIKMGRYPYVNFWGVLAKSDFNLIEHILAEMDLLSLKNKMVDTLSSGEKQRAHLARAFVQQAQILLLDEPFAHLDLYHTEEILKLLRANFIASKTSTLLISHDLNLLTNFCTHIVLLTKQGKVITGDPKQLLEKNILKEGFNLDAYHCR